MTTLLDRIARSTVHGRILLHEAKFKLALLLLTTDLLHLCIFCLEDKQALPVVIVAKLWFSCVKHSSVAIAAFWHDMLGKGSSHHLLCKLIIVKNKAVLRVLLQDGDNLPGALYNFILNQKVTLQSHVFEQFYSLVFILHFSGLSSQSEVNSLTVSSR